MLLGQSKYWLKGDEEMNIQRKTIGSVFLLLAVSLLPVTAQATGYTWTGTTSNAWNTNANWNPSTAYPNSYSDQATISGSSGTNKPGVLNSTVLLGIASGTALTTSGTSALSPLDIQLTGLLGMQGNISNSRSSGSGTEKITIEGTLRNDAATAGTVYTISGSNGSVGLSGGVISSQNGGIWSFGQAVNGYGTISAPFTNTSVITSNTSGQTLHITGSSTAAGSLACSISGAFLSLEAALSGVTISNHTGEIDLNGATLNGFTINNSGTGPINVTGDSTLSGTLTRNSNTPITLNGHTFTMNGVTISNVSGGTASIAVGTGTLNVANTLSSMSNGDPITVAGGSIISTAGGTFNNSGQIIGYGTVSVPVTNVSSGVIRASGGRLALTAPVTTSGTTMLANGVSGDILDLRSTVTATTSAWLYPNPSGNPGNGEMRFNDATINGPTGVGQTVTLGQGAVNVTDDSTVSGNMTSNAALTITSGKELSAEDSTFTNTSLGTVNNNGGTAAWGNFTNSGTYISTMSTQTFNTLTITNGSVTIGDGDLYQVN